MAEIDSLVWELPKTIGPPNLNRIPPLKPLSFNTKSGLTSATVGQSFKNLMFERVGWGSGFCRGRNDRRRAVYLGSRRVGGGLGVVLPALLLSSRGDQVEGKPEEDSTGCDSLQRDRRGQEDVFSSSQWTKRSCWNRHCVGVNQPRKSPLWLGFRNHGDVCRRCLSGMGSDSVGESVGSSEVSEDCQVEPSKAPKEWEQLVLTPADVIVLRAKKIDTTCCSILPPNRLHWALYELHSVLKISGHIKDGHI